MVEKVFKEIIEALVANANPAIRESGKRYFKEPIASHGMKAAVTKKIIGQAKASLKSAPKKDIWKLADKLWQTASFEEGIIACELAYSQREQYSEDDFVVFERWLNQYVSNWATCDTLCNHTIASFVMSFPAYIEKLKGWSVADHRWMKRGAAVTLIIPARNGLFLKDIFKIADTLMLDSDDLVQKGYGWMLKAASEAYQQEVFDYLMRHKETMPRTAFRYALEKMPKELRQQAMAKSS